MLTGTLHADPGSFYCPVFTSDVEYADRNGRKLHLQILTPQPPNYRKEDHARDGLQKLLSKDLGSEIKWSLFAPTVNPSRFPLIVDVPGSGWAGVTGQEHLGAMMHFARQGYVTASVEYRGVFTHETAHPAAVQDVKEAIRFLRAHADEFLIDPERVAVLGDSSGGHTAAFTALSEDADPYMAGEYREYSSSVKSCVIFYGPNDMTNLVQDRVEAGLELRPGEGPYPFEIRELFRDTYKDDPEGHLAEASAVNLIQKGKKMPPFLFLSGDADPIIPLAQGERFCQKVIDAGGSAEFYKIVGGGHGTGCWNEETLSLISRFLKATL